MGRGAKDFLQGTITHGNIGILTVFRTGLSIHFDLLSIGQSGHDQPDLFGTQGKPNGTVPSKLAYSWRIWRIYRKKEQTTAG
jgi:hypothetical protein